VTGKTSPAPNPAERFCEVLMGRHAASSNPPNVKPRPTDEEIQRQILSRVGQRVNFTYPGTEGSLGGVLKERIVIKGGIGASPDIPYWDVVDLIEFEGTAEPLCMRVGYYRYSGGRLNWGSQTTLTEPLSVWWTTLHVGQGAAMVCRPTSALGRPTTR